ncbi:MAG TPA: pyridoxine 5'-phosphate synthase [Cellvibrionaceae bacterium]
MSTALSVNLNKIALLRNSREGNYPNVLTFAQLCIDAGVQGLTVHPRPDQRHIRPDDARQLSALLQGYPALEFNMEGNPLAPASVNYPGFMTLVKDLIPQQCTLVPDSDQQLTSDHGFDLFTSGKTLQPLITELKALGIRVSLFMDPDIDQITQAKAIGADRIELYTGPYAEALSQDPDQAMALIAPYRLAAEHARSLGLGVNAGHDLNLHNLPLLLKAAAIDEVSIGHALTVDALHMGFTNALAAYLDCCQ